MENCFFRFWIIDTSQNFYLNMVKKNPLINEYGMYIIAFSFLKADLIIPENFSN